MNLRIDQFRRIQDAHGQIASAVCFLLNNDNIVTGQAMSDQISKEFREVAMRVLGNRGDSVPTTVSDLKLMTIGLLRNLLEKLEA